MKVSECMTQDVRIVDPGETLQDAARKMAEIDAGTGVLTTLRQDNEKATCGSEGRYQWDGSRFALQEIHWQDCNGPQPNGPPFPALWPTQAGRDVDPNGATPPP